MTKKDILFLLAPTVCLFACSVVLLFSSAAFFSNRDIHNEQWSQRNFDDFVKVETGESPFPPDKLVKIMEIKQREEKTNLNFRSVIARQLWLLGWCSVAGGLLQVYVILRAYAKYRKPAA
jgi:hypothetical protein